MDMDWGRSIHVHANFLMFYMFSKFSAIPLKVARPRAGVSIFLFVAWLPHLKLEGFFGCMDFSGVGHTNDWRSQTCQILLVPVFPVRFIGAVFLHDGCTPPSHLNR